MFRGTYQQKNSKGIIVSYSIGDSVLEQGGLYECIKPTSTSPVQAKNSWKFVGLTEIFKNDTPPVNPIPNQIWLSTSGSQYIWYGDEDGFQWVQV